MQGGGATSLSIVSRFLFTAIAVESRSNDTAHGLDTATEISAEMLRRGVQLIAAATLSRNVDVVLPDIMTESDAVFRLECFIFC